MYYYLVMVLVLSTLINMETQVDFRDCGMFEHYLTD